MAESSSAASPTLRAIGPFTDRLNQPKARFSFGTSPGEGRSPTIPLYAAGFRKEPPVSEPEASGTIPQASATAEPPEEPAADRAGSNGLPVAPCTVLRVLPPAAHSGVLVLPSTI